MTGDLSYLLLRFTSIRPKTSKRLTTVKVFFGALHESSRPVFEIVPTVFDIIVAATRYHLRNVVPNVAPYGLVALKDAIFLARPRDVLFEAWIENSLESTADLFTRAARQLCSNFRPRKFRVCGFNDNFVFVRRKFGTVCERVDFLPALLALEMKQ